MPPPPQQGRHGVCKDCGNDRREGVANLCRDQHQRHHYARKSEAQEEIPAIEVYRGAREAVDQLADQARRSARQSMKMNSCRRACRGPRHRTAADATGSARSTDSRRALAPYRSARGQWFPAGTAKTHLRPVTKTPIEDTRRPDGADDAARTSNCQTGNSSCTKRPTILDKLLTGLAACLSLITAKYRLSHLGPRLLFRVSPRRGCEREESTGGHSVLSHRPRSAPTLSEPAGLGITKEAGS